MNRNRVFAGLVVLALLWAGNVFYFEKHKLKEPIFLKHYYDLTLYGNELNLELFYFTNVQDNVKNLQIQLLGQDVLFLIIGENTTVRTSHYALKQLYVRIPKAEFQRLQMNELSFSDIVVQYSGGPPLHANIGNIRIRLDQQNETNKPILPRSSGGSSDSRSFAQFELGQPGKVEKIEFPKDHPAQDIYHLSVNGQPWQGAPLPTDFQSLIRIDNQITAKPGNIYAGELIIQFQMKDGSRQFGKMPVHANPPYQEAEIRKIVEGALQ
jgi:hypothetical protein